MFKKKASIIIPSWFAPGQDGKYGKNETYWFAQECLKRLLDVTPAGDYELIIIDNGSNLGDTDFTIEQTNELMPLADYWNKADILIRNKTNLGFGPACSQGFAVAQGEYIVCLNNDILLFPGWLEAMTSIFAEPVTPPVGVVMPALIRETKNAREALTYDIVDTTKNHNALGPGAEFGSLWVIQKRLLEQIRLAAADDDHLEGYYFDPNFLVGFGEDRDMWDRVRIAGYETYRTHKTRVFHVGNLTIGKVSNRRQYTVPNRAYLQAKREATKNGEPLPDRSKFNDATE